MEVCGHVTGAYITDCFDYLPGACPERSRRSELNSTDSGVTTHKFTGDERDSETSLDHTWVSGFVLANPEQKRFRQYSSQFGRWTSPDPAGLAAVDPSNPQSWNRYSYVLNNPMALIDPFGLDCAFLDDAGKIVEEIDKELNASGCGDLGGVFFAGSIDPSSVQPDPNSDFVFAQGTAGNSQFSCGGPNCDQQSLDAFANSLFGQSSGGVSENPGSFLSFIFSPSVPIYVQNDVPLNQNAQIILPLAGAEAAHALGCVGIPGAGLLAGGTAFKLGQPVPGSKPFVTPGTSTGTSPASQVLRDTFPQRAPFGIPTPVGGPGTGTPFRVATTTSVGGAAARYLPFVGAAVAGYSAYKMNQCLNAKP